MIRDILLWPNERLLKRSTGRISPTDLADLKETILAKDCMGLCTAQINASGRAFVAAGGGKVVAFINPKIISRDLVKQRVNEVNASFPDKVLSAKRFDRIKIKFTDEAGKTQVEEVDGALSATCQSMVDMLDGRFRV